MTVHVYNHFMYGHTYVTSVNITWSVSNLVPKFMDSIHSIERPVMWGCGQHLQAWTKSSQVNKHLKKVFPPTKLCPFTEHFFSWQAMMDFGRIKGLIQMNPTAVKLFMWQKSSKQINKKWQIFKTLPTVHCTFLIQYTDVWFKSGNIKVTNQSHHSHKNALIPGCFAGCATWA